MGYDIHITRRAQWSDDGDDITKDEFLAIVAADPEFLSLSKMGDDVIEWRSPGTGHQSPLFWRNGQIDSKNPSREFVDKLKTVARQLKANLQGDDGEFYYSAATGESSNGTTPLGWKPWWKIW